MTKVYGSDSDHDWDVNDDEVDDDEGLRDMELIAEIIPPTSTVPEIVLGGFDFTHEDANQHLFDMIVNGQLQGIAFEHCGLRDCVVSFDALASSRLQYLVSPTSIST